MLCLNPGVTAKRTLDCRTAADPTWAATLDTLRPPRRRDQKLADWRREAPIRPVVFEDAGVLGDDTVHLHLEQRVAQRLLARFRAQGFVHHDLSRACLAQARDSIPRVVLLGRLCLYGRRAERLHEEILSRSRAGFERSTGCRRSGSSRSASCISGRRPTDSFTLSPACCLEYGLWYDSVDGNPWRYLYVRRA